MLRYTLILSDVHLSPAIPGRETVISDKYLARTIQAATRRARADGAFLEIVLNGDFFDFDVPDSNSARTEADAARTIQQILIDHPEVTNALAGVIASGYRVVFVPGNHDSQLAFPSVRGAINRHFNPRGPQLIFRSWFHKTPDGAVIEHGHQYDPMCVMPRMFPMGRALEDTLGSVGSRNIPNLLGAANPYAVDPFAELPSNLIGALRDSIESTPTGPQGYSLKLLKCLRALMLIESPPISPEQNASWLAQVYRETGTHPEILRQHQRLFAHKASAGDLISGAIGGYNYGRDVEQRLQTAMTNIARLHRTPAVVMGHTHEPFVRRSRGVLFANSGTWAPVTKDSDPTKPVGSFVWLSSNPRVINVVANAPVASHSLRAVKTSLHHVWPNGKIS